MQANEQIILNGILYDQKTYYLRQVGNIVNFIREEDDYPVFSFNYEESVETIPLAILSQMMGAHIAAYYQGYSEGESNFKQRFKSLLEIN